MWRHIADRWPTAVALAACVLAFPRASDWFAVVAWFVAAALTLWWSAPRPAAPHILALLLFAASGAVLASTGSAAAGWLLPATGLAWAVAAVPTDAAVPITSAAGLAAIGTAAAAAAHRLPAATGLALGAAAGVALRERRGRRQAVRDKEGADVRAESAHEHAAVLYRWLREGLPEPIPPPPRLRRQTPPGAQEDAAKRGTAGRAQ